MSLPSKISPLGDPSYTALKWSVSRHMPAGAAFQVSSPLWGGFIAVPDLSAVTVKIAAAEQKGIGLAARFDFFWSICGPVLQRRCMSE